MAGTKLFVNNTPNDLQVTLYIRLSANPVNTAGTQNFHLEPSQSSRVTYGNDRDIYLNGISLVSVHSGEVQGQQEFVITRGSQLDNELNMNNRVEFRYSGGMFQIATSNG